MKTFGLLLLLSSLLSACVVVPARPGVAVVGPPIVVEAGYYRHGYYRGDHGHRAYSGGHARHHHGW